MTLLEKVKTHNSICLGVRSAMHAASQLPGRGPTDVDDALHVNQKSDYDMMSL